MSNESNHYRSNLIGYNGLFAIKLLHYYTGKRTITAYISDAGITYEQTMKIKILHVGSRGDLCKNIYLSASPRPGNSFSKNNFNRTSPTPQETCSINIDRELSPWGWWIKNNLTSFTVPSSLRIIVPCSWHSLAVMTIHVNSRVNEWT